MLILYLVGVVVGTEVGTAEILGEIEIVGTEDRTEDGTLVAILGFKEGATLEAILGKAEGSIVGIFVGNFEGTKEGMLLGAFVGTQEGLAVLGTGVGCPDG